MSVAFRAFQWRQQSTACWSRLFLPHGFWGWNSEQEPSSSDSACWPIINVSVFFFFFQGPRVPEVINCCFFYASPLSLPTAVRIPESLPLVSNWGAPRMLGQEQLKALLGNMQFYLGCNLPVLFESMLFIWKLLLWLDTYLPGSWLILWPCCNYFYYYFYFITRTCPEAHSPCACLGADSSRDESCQHFQLKWMRASSVLKLCLYRGARKMALFLLVFSIYFYSVAST